MSTKVEFDEKDTLDSILEKYHRACKTNGVVDPERSEGENLIQSFHSDLVETMSIGNQAHFEKTIGHGRSSIKLVGLSSSQRHGFSRFLRRLFGR